MKTFPLRKVSLAAAVVIATLALGCSNGKSDPTGTAAAAPSAAATAAPPLASISAPTSQYVFYSPTSEQGLKEDTHYGYLIAKVRMGTKPETFTREGLTIVGQFNAGGFTYYHLHKNSDLLTTLKHLKVTAGVLFAEPDMNYHKDAAITYATPDPRALSEQYSLALTHLKDAWTTYGFGPNKPVVADLDTGVNFGHEDLKDVVKAAFSWFDLDNADTPVPTPTAAAQPINYLGSATRTSTDEDGHGSHTAGIIAASGNNGKGMAGVCWNSSLVSYKVFDGAGDTTGWSVYGSLYHLTEWKKTNYPHTIAVNMSLGSAKASQFSVDMVELALESNLVIVASMGNSGNNLIQYPAGYAGVIAVGASAGNDTKASFSTSGRNISVTAPGDNIISTFNGSDSDYTIMSGTSMSAPFVTGLVTYMLTFVPDLNAAQIKTYLEANTDRIEGDTGFTERNGWGRVNVLKTIAAVVKDASTQSAPAANYVFAPLDVAVRNTYAGNVTPILKATVNLYSCDSKGAIANYAASSITDSFGTAYFNLLRPGYYAVGVIYMGNTAIGKVFQVTAGQSIPGQTIDFALPTYTISTLPDAGTVMGSDGMPIADSVVTIYNPDGSMLTSIDDGALDSFQGYLPSGTYTIKITAADGAYGEYALYAGASPYPTPTAPGSVAAPVHPGSQSHLAASPQGISWSTVYNGVLTSAPDYYTLTIP